MEVYTWQDKDSYLLVSGQRHLYGLWSARSSKNGHIVKIVGGYKTEQEAVEAINQYIETR